MNILKELLYQSRKENVEKRIIFYRNFFYLLIFSMLLFHKNNLSKNAYFIDPFC